MSQMQAFPLFSILIANYNNGRFLVEAIDSVFSQTYPNWEIIIVDDASIDNSRDLYSLFAKDNRIHVFYNDKNMGCAFTKHQLVLHANGEFCGYLDPDDVILPNAIEITMQALTASPDTVLTFSRHYLCDERLNIKEESRLLELKPGESYFEHHDYRAEVFAGFKKQAYLDSGGLELSSRYGGDDADLYFKLEEQGKVAILNAFTYKYRRHPNAMTADEYRVFYYNLMIRHQTCIRRGLPEEQYSLKDFKDFIQMNIDLKMSQNEQALSSKAYRLGKMILKPFSIFKH